MLGLLRGLMAETFTRFLDIVGHGDIDVWLGLGSVMPIKGKATVSGAGPVNGHIIVLFDGCNEMVGVGFTKIFNTEVIHTERKCCSFCGMGTQSRRLLSGVIFSWGKFAYKLFECNDSCLLQPIHTASEFQVDVSKFIRTDIIFFEDFWRDIVDLDP